MLPTFETDFYQRRISRGPGHTVITVGNVDPTLHGKEILAGTGELVGLAGTMAINVGDGQHSYDFEYTIGESGKPER